MAVGWCRSSGPLDELAAWFGRQPARQRLRDRRTRDCPNRGRECLLVSCVVRLDDVAGEAATVTDRPAFALRPVSDCLHGLPASAHDARSRRAARGGTGACAATRRAPAPNAPGGRDVGSEDLAQLLGVLV